MDPATEVARRRALGGKAEQVRVVAGELGEDVGAVGAAALVLREAFAAPTRGEDGPGMHRRSRIGGKEGSTEAR